MTETYRHDIIETAYRNFAVKNGMLSDLWFTKPDRVRNIIREHGGRISKRAIVEKCQDISQITIQRTLIDLQKSGEIIKLCGGRYASYIWKGNDMTDNEYYAKSENERHGAIPVREHCGRVSALSAKFGGEFRKSNEAFVAGLFHDFGKYSSTFADVLNGKRKNVDHAFPGAAFLFKCLKLYGQNGSPKWIEYEPIIESVAGHHDGLTSLGEMSEKLDCTYESSDADCCPSGKFPSLRGKAEFNTAKSAFREDFPDFRFTRPGTRDCENMVGDMLDTRMLFSCLVDADYSVSASDDEPDYLENNSRGPIDTDSALNALESHRAKIKRGSGADRELNALRDSVFEMCGKAGNLPQGLFTLTAPTGVGKTLAMLNFALRHCAANSMRRVIVVLPFLTLAEQTEKEYRKIFPDILVDHSQKELPDELRELSARWDYPVIITTSVRFFESLFADKPSDCRKLHNIANSVVLFDESQSLPSELAPATIKAVNSLCKKYNCSMVFSTATQPDFGSLKDTEWRPTEIVPDNSSMFDRTRRVKVEWRLFTNSDIGRNPTFADIASEMVENRNVCAIVNLRAHARELFGELRKIHGNDELYLLTTDLCPAHRLEVVKEIKARQNAHESCIVVATQCIEAGVDLDFDVMFRALAPLEGIIQAAGRCNRNKRLEYGEVIVFQPDAEGDYPGDSYGRAAGIVKNLWADNPELDICNPDVIAEYYRRFFNENKTNAKLDEAINSKDYADVAKEYKLIKNSGVQLIVPWSGQVKLFNEIKNAKKIDRELLRKAAPITVGCFDVEFVESVATQIKIGSHDNERPTGYYILNTGFYDKYDSVMGLQVSGNTDNFHIF